MSSITLTLNDNSSRMSAHYFPPIDISDGEYACGLIDFQTFNAIPNVDESNNLFHFESNSVAPQTAAIHAHIRYNFNDESVVDKNNNNKIVGILESIEIPMGTYEIEQIARYLKKALNKLNIEFDLVANKNTLKCEFSCSAPIDFTNSKSIGSLLGFAAKRYEANIVHESESTANILKVNIIRIECDLIRGSYINNMPAHTIHEFSPRVPPGYKIIEVPNKVIYFPVTVKSISSVHITLVDQNNDLINFRGETITVRVHIKKIK